jgi:hypothetical protein
MEQYTTWEKNFPFPMVNFLTGYDRFLGLGLGFLYAPTLD